MSVIQKKKSYVSVAMGTVVRYARILNGTLKNKLLYRGKMGMSEEEKLERVKDWFVDGIGAGFSPEQLGFLKDYFAFWSDVPKDISDLI